MYDNLTGSQSIKLLIVKGLVVADLVVAIVLKWVK